MRSFKAYMLALMLVLSMLMLTACTEPNQDTVTNDQQSGESTLPPEQGSSSDVNNAQSEQSFVSNIRFVEIDETVLLSKDGIEITAHGFTVEKDRVCINVHVVNNSELNLHIDTSKETVNGYMAIDAVSLDMLSYAGSEVDSILSIDTDFLNMVGIDTISQIQFCLEIYDLNTYRPIVCRDVVRLFTSAKGYEQNCKFSDETLFEDTAYKVTLIETKEYQDYLELLLFVENKTQKNVQFWLEDTMVNDVLYEEMLNECICSYSMGIYSVKLNFETMGISSSDEIRNMTFKVAFRNLEYSEYMFVSEGLTINLN